MMIGRRILQLGRGAVVALLVLFLWLIPNTARADPNLKPSPESVTLVPGASDRFVVTLQGAAPGTASLEVIAPPWVRSKVEPLRSSAGVVRLWIVTLAADASFDTEGTAILAAHIGSQVVTSTLPVKLHQAASAESQLKVELSFEGETLMDGQSRPLLVSISNLSDAPVQTSVQPRLPRFLEALAGDWKSLQQIPARTTILVPIPIRTRTTADNPLISGKHQVAATVTATRRASPGWSVQSVATAELAVGVPGMSEVQGILQLPSFLLFPGFLLVTAFTLTRRFQKRGLAAVQEDKAGLGVEWSSGLWLIAISLSMLMIPAYAPLSWLIGAGWRTILYGFDLSDVVRVWCASLIIGVIAALLYRLIEQGIDKHRAKSAFREGMAPLEFLDRLVRRNLSSKLPFVTLPAPGNELLFLLEEASVEGKSWAASQIICRIVDRDNPDFDQRLFGKKVRSGNASTLNKAVTEALECQAVNLSWAVTPKLTGVGQVDSSDFAVIEKSASILDLG